MNRSALIALSLGALVSLRLTAQAPCVDSRKLTHHPGATIGAFQVFDTRRGVLVVHGGVAPEGYRSDTWEWNGASWRLAASNGPSGALAAAFDSTRGLIVAFGGMPAANETWEWDGASWLLRTTAGPSARSACAMSFDRARNVCVLFGGSGNTNPWPRLGDTWEWNGSVWNQVATVGPSARFGHTLTFDPTRNVSVLLGGMISYAIPLPREVWEWNGVAWSLVTSAGLGRQLHAATWDPVRQMVVAHGGSDTSLVPSAELVGWNGVTLAALATTPFAVDLHGLAFDTVRVTLLSFSGRDAALGTMIGREELRSEAGGWASIGASLPARRVSFGLTHDAQRDALVLFGGMDAFDSGVFYGDVFEHRAGTWTEIRPIATLPPRAGFACAYDVVRGVSVVHGGYASGAGYLSDTWTWNGAAWTRAAVSSPGQREDHAMTFETGRGTMLLYGGRYSSGGHGGGGVIALQDTWTWNGVTWSQQPTASGPGRRWSHALGYDPVRNRSVLFGGRDGSVYYTDTWEWDGMVWARVATTGPTHRELSQLVFDAPRGVMRLLSGDVFSNDEWEWNGTSWRSVPYALRAKLQGTRVVADANRGVMLAVGGQTTVGSALRAQSLTVWQIGACGSYVTYGSGCQGAGFAPSLFDGRGMGPRIGAVTRLSAAGMPPAQPGFLALGASNTIWVGIPLPIDLTWLGAPGCALRTSVDVNVPWISSSLGRSSIDMAVPGIPVLLGSIYHAQVAVLAPGANAANLLVSAGLTGTIGD